MRPEDQAVVNEVYVNMGKSLAAYQTLLVSDRSDFDVFVEGLRAGDPERMGVLSRSAQRGLRLFVGKGRCHMCHQGPFFSDKEFHDLRLPSSTDLPTDHGRALGLKRVQSHPFNGLSEYSDDTEAGKQKVGFLARDRDTGWRQYKTPSLRNVEFTAPYMHQGQFETLREVLEYYSTFEGAADPLHPEMILTPLELSDQEIDDVIAFLRSLSDTSIDPALMERPGASPPAGESAG
jgi:cytochrome c peroxidase